MVKWLALVLTVATLAAPAQVVINELLIRTLAETADANRNHQWVELYNKGTDPVDLTGWKLANRDGRAGARALDLPSVSLPAGAYLVMHVTRGEDQLDFQAGAAHFYTQTGPGELLFSTSTDEIGLYSADATVDFLAWVSIGATYRPGAAHQDAVASRQWTENSALNLDLIANLAHETRRWVEPGASIGRDATSTDSNTPFDFDARGGQNSGFPTPGAKNQFALGSLIRVVAEGGSAQAAPAKNVIRRAEKAKWTVLLYINGDNNLASWKLDMLTEIVRAGGSTADVNFVALLDLRDIWAVRGRIRGSSFLPFAGMDLDVPEGQFGILGGVNMAAAATLRDFITWGVSYYPAERYILVVSAHGDSWKGVGPDDSHQAIYGEDFLYMNEFSEALAGQSFEIIWFADTCLMAGMEVAYQLRPHSRYLIAYEESPRSGDSPMMQFATLLRDEPAIATLSLGSSILRLELERITNDPKRTPEFRDFALRTHVASLIDLSRVGELARVVDSWAKELFGAVPVHMKRGEPLDNVQIRLSEDAAAALRFADHNYVDLYDLADRIRRDAGIPGCAKISIGMILSLKIGRAHV